MTVASRSHVTNCSTAGNRGASAGGPGWLPGSPCSLAAGAAGSAPRKAPLAPAGLAHAPWGPPRGRARANITPVGAAGNPLGVDNRGETPPTSSPPGGRARRTGLYDLFLSKDRSFVQAAAGETDEDLPGNPGTPAARLRDCAPPLCSKADAELPSCAQGGALRAGTRGGPSSSALPSAATLKAPAHAPRAHLGATPCSLTSSPPEYGLEAPATAAAALATMNKAAGGDKLADLLGLIPDLLEAANASGNASLQLQDLWWELGLELPDGAAPGPPPGGGGGGAESADPEARVRILISVVYWVVCALGLAGNLLVLYLMKSKQGWRKSSINLFVTNLALTDFQFVLTLPFWAVENALDFTWPFGKAMCKIVSIVTSMNMYASVFFLTAMSVARYHSVASALKSHRTRGHGRGACCGQSLGDSCCFSAKALCVLIWVSAALASLPNAVFSTTVKVMGEELCLVRFPDKLLGHDRQFWLGLYHSQKVLLGFVLPLGIISLCYLLLVRFISDRRVAGAEGGAAALGGGLAGASARRRSKVTKSVTIVVLSFFLCWLPNQALTTWSILIKFNAVPFSQEYFLCQVYAFPVSVCLAHSNSCLNPILYCLVRREFRKALKSLLWRIASPSLTSLRPFTASTKPEPEDQGLQTLAPLHATAEPDLLSYPPGVVVYSGGRYDLLPSSSAC
ncbi:relaxin-3 receptor 1 [Carlito syrichta]|uniref:Relaxin-3 receptor 1 n=1 Tax=Carlito syrichta TaxID=1868482 RepID=A0A1U7TQX5_CARSF|nr:relaxin-3 receptor 1 [Carlito syrichta]